jgi:hypothetical protein
MRNNGRYDDDTRLKFDSLKTKIKLCVMLTLIYDNVDCYVFTDRLRVQLYSLM